MSWGWETVKYEKRKCILIGKNEELWLLAIQKAESLGYVCTEGIGALQRTALQGEYRYLVLLPSSRKMSVLRYMLPNDTLWELQDFLATKKETQTYRDLLDHLKELSPEQLDCDITVELGPEDECFPATLRICGSDHELLNEDHPVIFVL